MAILTSKRTWRRRPELFRRPLERVTPEQQVNVRKVLAHVAADYGSARALARALGITMDALRKARSPCRPPTPRLAYAVARLLDVGVDHVLAGRWRKTTCEHCGETIIA